MEDCRPVHDVQLLPLGVVIPEAVGVRLQAARDLAALASKGRPDPDIRQHVRPALPPK